MNSSPFMPVWWIDSEGYDRTASFTDLPDGIYLLNPTPTGTGVPDVEPASCTVVGPFKTMHDFEVWSSASDLWSYERLITLGRVDANYGEDNEPLYTCFKLVQDNPHEIDPATGKPWPIEPLCCSYHEPLAKK